MKALSIRQPWAWLIVNGYKDIENRTWRTTFRGKFLVHASKTIDPVFFTHGESLSKSIACAIGREIPWSEINQSLGCMVGIAEIVDCVEQSESMWFDGPYGFVIKNVRPIHRFPYGGMLKFFEVSDYERYRSDVVN